MTQSELLDRIKIDPTVAGGLPCVRGTRIEVSVILDSLADGLSFEEIIDHFPHLTRDDIRAAIAYAGELARERVFVLAP